MRQNIVFLFKKAILQKSIETDDIGAMLDMMSKIEFDNMRIDFHIKTPKDLQNLIKFGMLANLKNKE